MKHLFGQKTIGKVPIWLLFGFFAQSLTTETVCTTALIGIVKDFAIPSSAAQLSSSVYFVGFALGIVTFGTISDRVGRRPVILCGLSLYILANICCMLSTNIESLIIARFFQAMGASVGSVIAQAMARDSYRGVELSYVYATVSLSVSFVPALGSTIGGFVVQYVGWRYNFFFLICFASTLLSLSLVKLPETHSMLKNSSAREKYFNVLKVVVSDKLVWLHAIILGCYVGIMFGFYLEAPFIFVDFLNISPSKYGLLTGALTCSALCGGIINRWLVKRGVDNIQIIGNGLLLGFSGCSALVILAGLLKYMVIHKYIAAAMLLMPMMMHSMSHAMVMPLMLRFALEDYAKVNGTAGSIFGGGYYIMVAMVNFMVSRLHEKSFMPVIILFLVLSFIANCSFYLIRQLRKTKHLTHRPYISD